MSEIKLYIGDIFDIQKQGADVLVNPVNCMGVMGKGLALEFKKRFPRMFDEYKLNCERLTNIRPGLPLMIKIGGLRPFFGTYVCCFPTKLHWNQPSQVKYVEEGLQWVLEYENGLAAKAEDRELVSFSRPYPEHWAFPLLGCGLGGLRYEVVVPMMLRYLSKLRAHVTLCVTPADSAKLRKIESGEMIKLLTSESSSRYDDHQCKPKDP